MAGSHGCAFSDRPPDAEQTVHDVIVIGAGVAGATAAHALAVSRPQCRILVLDRGLAGRGDESATLQPSPPSEESGADDPPDDAVLRPWISGSAVFDEAEGPSTVKMMVSLYASTSAEFLREHSMDDARTWFKMTSRGLRLQKEKARAVLPSPTTQLRELGSIMVAPPEHEEDLQTEYDSLHEAGCRARKMDRSEVLEATGNASGFTAGIEFPDDAIIDSSTYARCLLRDAERRGSVQVRERCPSVIDVADATDSDPAVVLLADGERLLARNVVVATGAFYHGGPLGGLLRPCYSYLVAMPSRFSNETSDGCGGGMKFPNSPNLFTYGFSHDWCLADGVCRMSGEDHYSAFKLPRSEDRCSRLAEWTYQRFPQLDRLQPFRSRYGVYSETPDLLPIFFGKTSSDSRVCYLVGCNAWGQAVMSSLGHMVPAVLAFRPYGPDEKEVEELCSIRRFPVACKRTHAVNS